MTSNDLTEEVTVSPAESTLDDGWVDRRAPEPEYEQREGQDPELEDPELEALDEQDPKLDKVSAEPDEKRRRFRKERTGGVAPSIGQPGRLVRWRTSRQLARRGFVPLSAGRRKLHHRILPRTVIGISTMFLSAGIGAAFSGAAFYAYYDDRLAQNEAQVATFVDGFETQFIDASGAIDEMRVESVEQIRRELGPLSGYVDDSQGIIALPIDIGPSVWTVRTVSETGESVAGSAFAVVGHNGGTALITSFDLVKMASVEPAPEITLVKGDDVLTAALWSWDSERDLALLVVDRDIEKLDLASASTRSNSTGARLFALSGTGGAGATASPGFLIDQSNLGIQHTVPVGSLFQGGPLVNGSGEVLGVLTPTYQPLGATTGAVTMSVDVDGICQRLLVCADEANDLVVEVPDVEE